MKLRNKLVAIAMLVMISLAALSGCNTMKGAGKDVENAGEAVQKQAD